MSFGFYLHFSERQWHNNNNITRQARMNRWQVQDNIAIFLMSTLLNFMNILNHRKKWIQISTNMSSINSKMKSEIGFETPALDKMWNFPAKQASLKTISLQLGNISLKLCNISQYFLFRKISRQGASWFSHFIGQPCPENHIILFPSFPPTLEHTEQSIHYIATGIQHAKH